MKIFKSIKWRLQLWYGLVLTMTIAAGIATSCKLEREQQLALVDRGLQAQLQNFMSVLHLPPPRPFDDPPPDMEPPDRQDSPPRFHLPKKEIESFFDNTTIVGNYYVIWSPDGRQLMRSTNAPTDVSAPVDMITHVSASGFTTRSPLIQTHGINRELIVSVPPRDERIDYNILVGISMSPELEELRRYKLKQLATGLNILILGLAIGWWIVFRSLRPISEISSAAVKISAGDLSQRISIAETESELGQLAAVLNATFARLEAAFAQQQQFTSDAAHELRTPVSVMLTQTQTALTREREAADYKQTVESCERAAQRMRKLIESLLALARLDAGQEILKRLRFDFSKTIADCTELVKPIAEERGVKIYSELAPLEITGDSERLAQVVTNLLTNAIQYNNSGGEVRVQLETETGLAVLKISDTGRGIAAEDLPRVFERFYRADSSRTGAGNSGLGLAISKAIVEAHGGTIEAASAVGQGAVFTVRLPV
jgi:two-component system, OmpR family, sensor kinase